MLLLFRSIETTNASAFEVFRKIMLAFVYAKDSFMLNDKRQRRFEEVETILKITKIRSVEDLDRTNARFR